MDIDGVNKDDECRRSGFRVEVCGGSILNIMEVCVSSFLYMILYSVPWCVVTCFVLYSIMFWLLFSSAFIIFILHFWGLNPEPYTFGMSFNTELHSQPLLSLSVN